MLFSNFKSATSAFATAMANLEPGDILTNLNLKGHRTAKILVLERDETGQLVLSHPSDKICICRRPESFFWSGATQCLASVEDGEPDLITDHSVEILKGQDEGLRAVILYNSLSRYKSLFLNLTEARFQRFFNDEPTVSMMFDALISDGEMDSFKSTEACLNYAFAGRENPLTRRELILLCAMVNRLVLLRSSQALPVFVVVEPQFKEFFDGEMPSPSLLN